MFSKELFLKVFKQKIRKLDNNQRRSVMAPLSEPLFVVAGPGSGKTTVLAGRVLKLIFVDGLGPESIVATTFTRRAAEELRSRILTWGDSLRTELGGRKLSAQQKNFLKKLYINRLVTGTLDSISQTIMQDFRAPGVEPPVVLDQFVAKSLLLREGLFESGRYQNQDLREYLKKVGNSSWYPSIGDMVSKAKDFSDRFLHDCVDVDKFTTQAPAHPGRRHLADVVNGYLGALAREGVMDFAMLEEEFYERLAGGQLETFCQGLRAVLVDEYQDTNLLQEMIYFELARRASGAITVVGDDDQSLYRFRGATVDLFTDFPVRVKKELRLRRKPKPEYLLTNYRSTQSIIKFYNAFASADPDFQPARVKDKPEVTWGPSAEEGHPVLGLFRDDIETLAEDLSRLVKDIFMGGGLTYKIGRKKQRIKRHPRGGAVGDCSLLMGSPQEYSSGGKERLPLMLREKLSPMKVFNPRGQNLSQIEEVQLLCGLMLECLDPGEKIQNGPKSKLNKGVRETFKSWRGIARRYIETNPAPHRKNNLPDFVNAWGGRSPQGISRKWPKDVPLLELCYHLLTWVPILQDDPEGQVYLEVISRTIVQAARFSSYESRLVRNYDSQSVYEAMWQIFVPLATGAVDIDEELIESFPRDRLSILSIHQSKGLEFPLTIVDVGSDFKSNHHTQAFKRFPKEAGPTQNMEDETRPFSPISQAISRPALDRAFDDLLRQYYVALSRSQSVLVLVGLAPVLEGRVLNVATGWHRKGKWAWKDDLPIHLI